MSSWSKTDLPLNSAWQEYQQSAPVSLSIQGVLATTAQSHVKQSQSQVTVPWLVWVCASSFLPEDQPWTRCQDVMRVMHGEG